MTPPRVLSFKGCNGVFGRSDIEEGRLVSREAYVVPTTMTCLDGTMEQDRWLVDFLRTGPRVIIAGDHLTLATDHANMEFGAS